MKRFTKIMVVALAIGIGISIAQQNSFAQQSKKSMKKEDQECNNRGRRFGWGFLGGGATGGLIAGVAGSAKWVPLGIVGGGLIGGGIAAATAKKCNKKQDNNHKNNRRNHRNKKNVQK